MLLLAAMLLAGCKKEEYDYENNSNPSQDVPSVEKNYTDYSCLYMIVNDDADGYFALAKGKNTDFLLHLDANGVITNQSDLGFRSRRCILETPEYLIVVGAGGSLSTPYAMNTHGWVAAFDHSLNLVSICNVYEELNKVEINSIVQDPDDATLFYAGGFVNVEAEGYCQQRPYVCTLRFDGTHFNKESSCVFSQYNQSRIIGLLIKQQAGQKDLIFEMLCYQTQNDPYDWNNTLHFVKPNFFDEQTGWGSVIWNTELEGYYDMTYHQGDDLVSNNGFDSDENNIYVFGRVHDEKENSTSSGGRWRSGCVTAVNWHDGQMLWTQKLNASECDDDFYNGKLIDGYLYICGRHSGVYYHASNKYLGNGLLAKYSVSGTLLSYKTFGQSDRYSWLIKPTKNRSGEIVCVGATGENIGRESDDYLGAYTGRFSGWFLKTDMSNATHKTSMDAPLNQQKEMRAVILSAGCGESISNH